MQRIPIQARHEWQKKVENLGFGFHTTEAPYWCESAYYRFTMDEITAIETATAELWEMCLEAVEHIIYTKSYAKLHIPEWFVPQIERSWYEDAPSIYGRFDFAYNKGQIKLLEFNADTPTSLFEAAIVQWHWLEDFDRTKDQFNSIHEKLIAYWVHLQPYVYNDAPVHFSCVKDNLEDLTTVEYLRDCAIQGRLDTKLVFLEDIGWDASAKQFLDMEDVPIKNIFKLYPYEWLINEAFGKNILIDKNEANWIEPAWKMLLSNKAILPILWSLFPNHKYLLASHFEKGNKETYVKKPILSREGANIDIVVNGKNLAQTSGEYGEEGYIYQDFFQLPEFSGNYPLIGSWLIGQEPAGIGIRESDGLITDNKSRFVPHLIV